MTDILVEKKSTAVSEVHRKTGSNSERHFDKADLETGSTERHYSMAEIATMWGVSVDLVRDIFKDAKHIMRIHRPATKFKRAYTTVRVPASTLKQVYESLKPNA